MVIENIIQQDILSINKEIIKKRVSLQKLLEKPVIEEKGKKIKIRKECLERIAEHCNLPQSQIFLPITFFIPAGSYEGYILSSVDAEVLASLGYTTYLREDKYWLAKHKIRKLISSCPGVFQSIILP